MWDRWEDDSQKKGDRNDPWMDWCLGTIFWTHCEDWHPSHCNSRTERPTSKSSLSTSIWRRVERTTLSIKIWVPGTEKMSERYAGTVTKRCWNRIHPNKCQEMRFRVRLSTRQLGAVASSRTSSSSKQRVLTIILSRFFVDSSSTEAAETGFRTQPVATAVSATGV